MVRRQKQDYMFTKLKNYIKDAYKMSNIPLLNDISETILDLINEAQNFRITNRRLEPEPLYKEVDQLVDLYSQILRLVYRIEFHN